MAKRKKVIKVDDGRKKRKVIEGGNCHLWSELPAELLESILNRLGAIEFLTSACVCKSWRAVAVALKQQFMASKPPLIFLSSINARKYGYFYNMFDESLYKILLPHLSGHLCLGFTCGYLVLRKTRGAEIWLVNPFTSHELKFPPPPNGYSQVILASLPNKSSSVQQYVAVAISKYARCIQFCRYGDGEWTVERCIALDVVAFKGKIYVMTSRGRLGVLSLNPNNPTVTMLPATTDVSLPSFVNMVADKQHLYLLHLDKMERLDFERMVWEKVEMNNNNNNNNNNGEMINSFSFIPPFADAARKRWEMISKRWNGVWYIEEEGEEEGRLFSFEDHCKAADYVTSTVSNRIRRNRLNLISPFWYFPHLSCTVDVVNED